MGIGVALRKFADLSNKQATASWTINIQEEIIAPPITYKDNIIIGTRKGKIIQLDAKGQIMWTFSAHEKVGSKEALFLDEDNVYGINDKPLAFSIENEDRFLAVSEFGILYCISQTGKSLWKVKTGGPLRASPVIASFAQDKKRIFLTSHDGFIYIIDFKGNVEHKFEVYASINTRPIITGKLIIVSTIKGEVIALNHEGQPVWKFKTGDKISAHMSISDLGNGAGPVILVGSEDKKLYALNLDGEPEWSFLTEGTILAQPIACDVNNDGQQEVFLASCDNSIYCLTPFGEKLWSYETDFWITTAPLVGDIDDDGTIEVVVGSLDSKMYVFDSEGSYKVDYVPGLGGIVHQTGHYSGNMNKDVGENKGKLFCEFKADEEIIGYTYLKASKTIIVATKKGKIYNIKVN
ncbi:PQQ-binding-like beta-propeller repeat protein [Candidatus Woesearchaeota archaeon]|nr:PQQ-binding-like beta-propeller repeat protein [Candidatus Woesearchaeota archaeon]